ncbi:MAG: PHP domain-containing protein [Erysipelotrichaceae bacterium]
MIRYDLHIHSALSPCADDEMTIQNIIKMAHVCGLDWIAICDHNHYKALTYANKLQMYGVGLLYGMELTTREEVHLLALFSSLTALTAFYETIAPWQTKVLHQAELFGNQWIYDELDQKVETIDYTLWSAIDCSIDTLCQLIHEHHGKAVLAHIYHASHGVLAVLGFIPKTLAFDAIEVQSVQELQLAKLSYSDAMMFLNSDAHRLVDIDRNQASMEPELWHAFWRDLT